MSGLFDLLSDYGPKILGGKKYRDWQEERFKLQKVKIKNKKLAQELENECIKNGGFLTYSEYLQIEQFGKNGYHSLHKTHGFTPTFKTWTVGLFNYIYENRINNLIELGPGDGSLASELFSLSLKNNYHFTWDAVEVNEEFRQKINKRFKNNHKHFLKSVVKKPQDLPKFKKALIISSFCLDSVPVDILINSKNTKSSPDSIVGVRVKNGIIEEFILNDKELVERNIRFLKNQIEINGCNVNLSNIKLDHMQRVYLTLKAYALLTSVLKRVEDPTLLIIDEFRTYENILTTQHLLQPLFLSVKNRHKFNPKTNYERAGELLFYYPLYLPMLLSVLKNMRFKKIQVDTETKMSAKLAGDKILPLEKSKELCFGVLASQQTNL